MSNPSTAASAPSSLSPDAVSIAGPMRRIAALGYDILLLGGISLIYGAIALAIGKAVGVPVEQAEQPLVFTLTVQIGWVASIAGFYSYFWTHGGQTLGMRAWRLRLVTPDGKAVNLSQSLKRCVVAPVVILLGGLGYWWCWFNSEKMALQDLLSNTAVVCLPKPPKTTGKN